MAVFLDEYSNDPALIASAWGRLTTTKSDMDEAVDELFSTATKVAIMMLSGDARLEAMGHHAEAMQARCDQMCVNGAPIYDIYAYAKESSTYLKEGIEDYNKRKEESERAKANYAKAGDQFDAKIKNSKINSAPLNFSGITKLSPTYKSEQSAVNSQNARPDPSGLSQFIKSQHEGSRYRAWCLQTEGVLPPLPKNDGAEKMVRFGSKAEIVSAFERKSKTFKQNNMYLFEKHIIDRVADHFAGKRLSEEAIAKNVDSVLVSMEEKLGTTIHSMTAMSLNLTDVLHEYAHEGDQGKK